MMDSSSPKPLARQPMACLTCRARKVKCDKLPPCLNCRRANQSCVFPPPTRTVNRPKRINATTTKEAGSKELLDRIKRLEDMVKSVSSNDLTGTADISEAISGVKRSPLIQFEGTVANKAEDDRPSLAHYDQGVIRKGPCLDQRKVGGGVHATDDPSFLDWLSSLPDDRTSMNASNGTWKNVESVSALNSSNLEPSLMAPQDPMSCPKSDAFSKTYQQSSSISFPNFPFSDIKESELAPLCLSRYQKKTLWSAFVENVDLCLKVVHKQTIERVLFNEKNNEASADKSNDAVIAAVFLSAAISMKKQEIQQTFQVEPEVLVARLKVAAEKALVQADFLNTENFSTLQALVIFLFTLKGKQDLRYVTLTGVAFKIAQRLKLHVDDSSKGQSFLNRELHRRLWWQLLLLEELPEDQLVGLNPTQIDFDTRMPLNLNDSDIDSSTIEEVKERRGLTEMTFSLILYEMANLGRQIQEEKRQSVRNQGEYQILAKNAERRVLRSKARVESQILQYCPPEHPFSWFAANVANIIMAKRWLSIYLSPFRLFIMQPLSPEIKSRSLVTSVQLLENSRRLQRDAKVARWKWLTDVHFQWSVTSFVLDELPFRPYSPLVGRGWKVINGILNDWPEEIRNSAMGRRMQSLLTNVVNERMSPAKPLQNQALQLQQHTSNEVLAIKNGPQKQEQRTQHDTTDRTIQSVWPDTSSLSLPVRPDVPPSNNMPTMEGSDMMDWPYIPSMDLMLYDYGVPNLT